MFLKLFDAQDVFIKNKTTINIKIILLENKISLLSKINCSNFENANKFIIQVYVSY
jgi:hypothetical protein